MKWLRNRKLIPVAIVVVAVLLMLVLSQQRSAPPQRPTAARVTSVEVIEATPSAAGFEVRSQGTVQPRTQTSLVSEVSGVVTRVSPNFVVGGFFSEGEVLLEIDPRDYDVAVVRAEAALANRAALLAQEEARAEQAGKDWASLGRSGTPNPLVLRTPYVDEAKANVRAAEADLAAARIDLQRTRVRAPFDGLLLEKHADVGQYVTVGGALADLAGTALAEVRLPLTQSDLASIGQPDDEGMPVQLTASDQGPREARFVRTEGVLDERTRVTHAVLRIDDPYQLDEGADDPVLPFGSFVEARLPASVARAVIGVPRRALRGMDQLLLVDAEDKLRLRTVEVLRSDADRVYIASGLQPGERVVTTVIEAPIEGMPVRVVGAEPASAAAAEAADLGEAAGESTADPQ